MIKDKYFSLMKETSQEVNKYIERSMSEFPGCGDLENLLRELPNKRKTKPQLRPLLTRLSYQICGGEDWRSIVPALASMELNNIHLYLHNWIFDNKNLVWEGTKSETRKRVNDLIISSQIFRELSEQALDEEISSFDNPTQSLVRSDFRASIIRCYRGFKQDLDLSIDNFSQFSSEKDFIKKYRIKSENQSGNFYGFTSKLGAILSQGDSGQISSLEDFGFYLGAGLHISNDLGDFALPNTNVEGNLKPYQDQLSDIKEGRLTFPIYYVLKNGTEEQKNSLKNLIGNYQTSYDELKRASRAVIDSGAYDFCRSFSKEYYKKGKKILHENFSPSKERDFLSLMISSIRSNKFLVELGKMRGGN